MRAWSFYALHTFVNCIKKIFRSTFLIFFAVCILCGLIFGLGMGLVFSALDGESYEPLFLSEITPDGEYVLLMEDELYAGDEDIYYNSADTDSLYNSNEDTYTIAEKADFLENTDYNEEDVISFVRSGASLEVSNYPAIDSDASTSEMSSEEAAAAEEEFIDDEEITEEDFPLFAEAVAEIVFLIFILFAIYFGGKKGCDIFLMPDVNFLFPAPLKGQSVLLFRLSFQLVGTFLGCLYLLFQIPNLLNAGMSLGSIFLCLGGVLLMLLMQKIINVLSYIICSKYAFLKKNLLNFIIAFVIVFASANYLLYRHNDQLLIPTVQQLYGANATRFIPVFGWFKAIIGTGINGEWLPFAIYLTLFLLSLVLVFYLTWNLETDFYEEALLGAATRDEVLQAAQEKKSGVAVKRKKDRADRIKRNTGMRGFGASMFFHKEMYNRKRMCYFGLISKTMITYFLVAACSCVFMLKIVEASEFTVIAIEMSLILFFRSFANPIATECENAWLTLVPADSIVKVFYSMLAGTVACALDMLPALVFSAVLLKADVVLVLLWFITLILMDFALSAMSVMFDALIPAQGMDQIKAGISMMLRFTLAGILFAIIGLAGTFLSMTIGLVLAMVFCIICGLVGFFIYPMKMEIGF